MIGFGTLFKKNISNFDHCHDSIPSSLHYKQNHYGGGREIRPQLYQDTCGICGRTILTGETTDLFRHNEEARTIVVCGHCRPDVMERGYKKIEQPLPNVA